MANLDDRSGRSNWRREDVPWPPTNNSRAGLALLLQAYQYAEALNASLWDFALEIDLLYEAGLTTRDLHWLTEQGFAEQHQETSRYNDAHRSFCRSQDASFRKETCFVLTASGAQQLTVALQSPLEVDKQEGSQARS